MSTTTDAETKLPTLLKAREVQRVLRISPRHLSNLMKSRRLAFIRIGRSVRFAPESVAAFQKSFTVKSI